MSKWIEIRNDYFEDNKLFIDAYLTNNNDEEGSVIAKIDVNTKEIEYLDEDAKTDNYAQEVINRSLIELCK